MQMQRWLSVLLLALAAVGAEEEEAELAGGSAEAEEPSVFTVESVPGLEVVETFQDGMGRWIKSVNSKYNGNAAASLTGLKGVPAPWDGDFGLELKEASKFYGLSLPFDTPIDNTGKTLVVQYEVKFTDGHSCAGAYIKLLSTEATGDLEERSPFVVMFGPDKCGETNKVHFIFRHQNPISKQWEEKHLKTPPTPRGDKRSHLYTLVIRPDNDFEIFTDLKSVSSGNMLDDFSPDVNPQREIPDPDEKKPADWVDEPKMEDPDDFKPEDWDEDAPKMILNEGAVRPEGWLPDEPEYVHDPSASRPPDWDDEEDGEWEAPLVWNVRCDVGCGEWERPMMMNPAYKGKWTATKVNNPAYKGEWAPKKIANPHYFTDTNPHNLPPISGLAVEVWSMDEGIRFDNFMVSYSEEAAKSFAEATFVKKNRAEVDEEERKNAEEEAADRAYRLASGGGLMLYVEETIEWVKRNSAAVGFSVLALIVALFAWCIITAKGDEPEEPAAPIPSRRPAPAAPSPAAEPSPAAAAAESPKSVPTQKRSKSRRDD